MKYPLCLFLAMMLAAWGISSCIKFSNSHQESRTLGKVVWDFSKNRDITTVGWPKEISQQFWFSSEIADLTIIFPDGASEHFLEVQPIVKRAGNCVVLVGFDYQEKSIESAVKFAGFWCKRWNVTKMAVSLDEFQSQVLKDPNYPRVVSGEWRGSGNRSGIEIRPASPWVVQLNFDVTH